MHKQLLNGLQLQLRNLQLAKRRRRPQPRRKTHWQRSEAKALVKERIDDWRKGLCIKLKKHMVELTGDYTPDLRALQAADLIVA